MIDDFDDCGLSILHKIRLLNQLRSGNWLVKNNTRTVEDDEENLNNFCLIWKSIWESWFLRLLTVAIEKLNTKSQNRVFNCQFSELKVENGWWVFELKLFDKGYRHQVWDWNRLWCWMVKMTKRRFEVKIRANNEIDESWYRMGR